MEITPQAASELAQRMIGEQGRISLRLKPHTQKMEWLNSELQRTHATIQAMMVSREDPYKEVQTLQKLREEFFLALQSFSTEVEKINHGNPS